MEDPLPCPFCGQHLKVLTDPDSGRVITYGHDQSVPCFLNDKAVAAVVPAHVRLWNRRAAAPKAQLGYVLKDGLPEFNDYGQGTPADASFLNKCFDYLRRNNPWAK